MGKAKLYLWNNTAKGLSITIVGIILALCAVSCSRAPDDPAWFESTTTGESLDDQTLIDRIGTIDDILTLYRMKKEYPLRGGRSAAITRALSKRMDRVASDRVPLGSPCPEVDLLAFDYRRPGPGQYRVDFLFRINKPLPKNLKIGLLGEVSPEDLDQLSLKRRKAGKKGDIWSLQPSPSTLSWKPGEYVLVSKAINGRPIPYNFRVFFFDPEKKSGEQLYGNIVSLGWCSGLSDKELLNNIAMAGKMIDLYRLAGDTHSNPATREAFDKKSAELLEETKPLDKICPEADLVAFDYQKIGDKRYRVDYLFRVNQSLDSDCLIILIGVVDENHCDYLSEKRKKLGKNSEIWSFRPNPHTEDWPEGQFVLVSDAIEAQPIPYEMYTSLYDKKGRRQHGEKVPLGWRADPGESKPATQ